MDRKQVEESAAQIGRRFANELVALMGEGDIDPGSEEWASRCAVCISVVATMCGQLIGRQSPDYAGATRAASQAAAVLHDAAIATWRVAELQRSAQPRIVEP